MSRNSESRLFHEMLGLTLLGLGTLLFLALVSYDARDVPGWFPLAYGTEGNVAVQNFTGTVGAMVACTFYFLLGAASYLVSVLLFGCGAAKLMNPAFRVTRRLGWMIAFIISAACLLAVQRFTLQDWTKIMKAAGPGGELGDLLGAKLLEPLFGIVGSIILLGIIYLVSLIRITGIHPVLVLRWALGLIPASIAAYQQWRLRRADEEDRLELERKRLEGEHRKLERQVARRNRKTSKGSKAKAEEEDDFEDEVDDSAPDQEVLEDRPPPRVIDTTAPAPRRPAPLRPAKQEAPTLTNPLLPDGYDLPTVDLLDLPDDSEHTGSDPNEMLELQATIVDTLKQFNIEVAPADITRGPTITRYEVYPAKGVRVDKIVSLERDIARATRAERINILAPIPGKDVYGNTIIGDLASMPHLLVAGTTGSGKSVCINSIIASILYRFTPDEMRFIMIDPKVVEMQVYNQLPHLVIPVVTDSKKVLLALRWVIDEMERRYKIFAAAGVRNITSFNARPKPKRQAELDAEADAAAEAAEEAEAATALNGTVANRAAEIGGRPSVLTPSVLDRLNGTPDASDEERAPWEEAEADEETDAQSEEASENQEALDSDGMEAEDPRDPLEETSEETLEEAPEEEEEEAPRIPIRVRRDDEIEIPEGDLPYIVVIIDELADLMQTAPADVESAIARITQMARAAGIHMIVATQTPRADVITGVIKANIPTRIAFQVASGLDSRIILDEKGAERLLGQGDMMYVPPGTSKMTRAQGVFVTDEEIRRVVEFSARQGTPDFDSEIHDRISGTGSQAEEVSEEDEELVQKCIEIMRQEKRASTSLFQRRLRLGYTRAARVVDILEQRRYIAAGEGAKPREILVDLDELI